MAPKKTTADSMVEDKPPDIVVPEKTTREPKTKKRVAAPRVPRVKKAKARLKPVHIVKVKIPAPKVNETQEPDIKDEPVEEIEEESPFTTTIKPKTKPPSYPRKLKKEVALKIANEVALAQLVKKPLKSSDKKTKSVKKRIRKSKEKPPSPGSSIDPELDVSIATFVKEDKKELAVEPIVKAPKAAVKKLKKHKPKLQAPTQGNTETPTDVSNTTFTEGPFLNGNIPKVPKKRVYKKKGKLVSEDIGENNTTLEVTTASPVIKTMPVSIKRPRGRPKLLKTAESMDTSGAPIEESKTISVKKRRGRPRVVRKNAALNETDGGKDPEPTNIIEAEQADSVTTAKNMSSALITQTDNNKKDILSRSRTISVSDTFSWARDISSSSAGTTPSSRSLECLNGKQLTVKVVDNVYKMIESFQLRKKLPQLLASSEKNNGNSNVAVKKAHKRSVPKRCMIPNEDITQEFNMSPPNKKTKLAVNEISTSQQITEMTRLASGPAENSPRKSTRLKNKLVNSPLEKTEEPKLKNILKLPRSSKTEGSNFSENTKSGSRTSLESDVTSETNKQAGKYSESSSSKVTSSMSIPMSAISEITRREEANIEECLRTLSDILSGIDLEESLEDQNMIKELSQIPQNNLKFEIDYLSKWKNRKWTPLPNEAQSEKEFVKNYSCTKSMDCTTSEPKENNPMENHTNSPSALEHHMNSPNAVENHTNLFNSVDDRVNFSNAEEYYVNASNAIEHELENNARVVNLPNAIENKFENNKELDSFSDIVRQQSYERRSHMDDDDDLISLFADSIISGIESSKGHPATVVCPFDKENNSKKTEEPFTIPKLSKRSEETLQIPKQAREKIVIKNKTKIICEKQNADSTSINKEEQNKKKNIMAPPIVPNITRYQSTPSSQPSLLGACKTFNNCSITHRKRSPGEIQSRLFTMSDDDIKMEYLSLTPYPNLKRQYMLCFANVCKDKNIDFLLQIALDSVKESQHLKTLVLETTLLYLNEKSLNAELLMKKVRSGVCLCDALMRALGETQNFSRFKKVFLNLTELMITQNRKFDLDTAMQLLERNLLLHPDENVLKALVQMLKNTDSTIFENCLIPKFEEMLYNRNRSLYEEITQHKQDILKLTLMPCEPAETDVYADNFSTEQFVKENNNGIQSMAGQANTEKQRYTSPDTTHLDNLHNKPVTEPPVTTRTDDFNNRIRTYILPALPGGSSQNFNNHNTPPPPSDNQLKRLNYYKTNYNNGWRRGNARMPRMQPNIVQPMVRQMAPPSFRQRGGYGYQRNPWQYYRP